MNTKNKIIIISIVIFLMIICIGFYISSQKEIIYENDEDMINTEVVNNIEENKKIIIHISGCVNMPGIVELDTGSRIINAIEKAGGLKDEADLTNVNLAYELTDGIKVYIPSKDENDVSIIQSNGEDVIKGEKNNNKININNASKAELQKIDGIGESTANKIIEKVNLKH